MVTEARVRLLPAPPAMLAGVVFFPADEPALDAVEAVARAPRAHAGISRRALARHCCARAFPEIPAASRGGPAVRAGTGFAKTIPEVDRWLDRIEAAGALRRGARGSPLSAADRERFRLFRHSLPELVNDTVRRTGALKMNTDYAVPLARNREMLAYYRRAPGRRNSPAAT